MEQQSNINEQLLKQLQETNHRLLKIQRILVGVLITTGIAAVFFIILYSKLSGMAGEGI